MGVLALEFFGLNSSFQGLKFVWWWGVVSVKEMVNKEMDRTRDSVGMDIDYAFWEI